MVKILFGRFFFCFADWRKFKYLFLFFFFLTSKGTVVGNQFTSLASKNIPSWQLIWLKWKLSSGLNKGTPKKKNIFSKEILNFRNSPHCDELSQFTPLHILVSTTQPNMVIKGGGCIDFVPSKDIIFKRYYIFWKKSRGYLFFLFFMLFKKYLFDRIWSSC